MFDEFDSFFFDGDSFREMDLEIPAWGRMYEFDFGEVACLAMYGIGILDQFRSALQSETAISSVLDFAHQVDSPVQSIEEIEPYALAALLATVFNVRSISRYQLSISEFVEQAENGDIDAMLTAIRLDPASLNAEPLARIYSKATLGKDRKLLKLIGKAVAGKSPRLPEPHLANMRIAIRMLQDSGSMTNLTVEGLRELVVDRLRLYPADGDSHSAIRREWRTNKRLRGE